MLSCGYYNIAFGKTPAPSYTGHRIPRKKLLTTSGPSAIIGSNQKTANTATETSSRAQDAPREPRMVESGSGRLCELTPEWPTQTGFFHRSRLGRSSSVSGRTGCRTRTSGRGFSRQRKWYRGSFQLSPSGHPRRRRLFCCPAGYNRPILTFRREFLWKDL